MKISLALGQSLPLDFAVFAGLGVATASIVVLTIMAPHGIESLPIATWKKSAINAFVKSVLIASIFALVIAMRAVEALMTTEYAKLGFVIGAPLALAMAYALRKRKQ